MPPIAVHEVTTFYNMYNQQPVGKYKLNVCTNLPCQLRDGAARRCTTWSTSWASRWARPRPTACSRCSKSECLGACADAPVMLVNDRTMCSFMSDDKLDELVEGLSKAEAQAMNAAASRLSQFQATGVQTCFHDRHIDPQIYAGLDGTNWRLEDYEARDGYKALRKILERGHHAGPGDRRRQGIGACAAAAARVSRPA